jgi:hypothetical protein
MPQLLGPAMYLSGCGALLLISVALHWWRKKIFVGVDATALVTWSAPPPPLPSKSRCAPTLWSTVCANPERLLARSLFWCFCVALVWGFVPYYAWKCAGTATLVLVELTFLAQLHAEAIRNRRRAQCSPEIALRKREADSIMLPCSCDYSPSRYNRRSREWKALAEHPIGGLIPQKQVVGAILNGASDALVQAGSKLPVIGPLIALGGKAGMGWLITKCMGSLFPVDPPPPDPVLKALGRIEHQIDALHGKVDQILANLAESRLHDDYLRAVSSMEPVVRRLSAIRDQWEAIVTAPATSRERSTKVIIEWRDAVLHPRDGLLPLLKTYAYGSSTVLAATGALYGTARQDGVYQAWQDVLDFENRTKWTLRTQAAQTACNTPEKDRINVWKTLGTAGKVHANMLRDQADLDAVWQQATQWLQVQTLCMQMILEASHVPDATTPQGQPTTAETLEETSRAASQIVTSLKFIKDHMDRQRTLYLPQLPLGIDTFQYVVQGASNLVFALWDKDERPNTAADGVDERSWRLATKAEITFLLLQMGAPAPCDTTIDSWRRPIQGRTADQAFLMMGANGPERLMDIDDYMGVTTSDERTKQWYDTQARDTRVGWDNPLSSVVFWPRIDVTKSVWHKVGRFGDASGTTPLSFCVGNNLEDTDTVYRADLNWFVPRGSTVFPPVDRNQPRYELRVRTYDARPEYRPLSDLTRTSIALQNGIALKTADDTAYWYLEDNRRHHIVDGRVSKELGADRTLRTVSDADLDSIEVGAPYYFDSYYDTRRFITDLPYNAGRPKEGDVIGLAGDGIWKIVGGRRHWLSTVDAYNDLKQGYTSPPSLSNRWLLRDIPIGYIMKYRPLPAAATGHVKTGDLVQCRHHIFYIQGGTKHYISPIVYTKLTNPSPRNIACDILDAIPNGDPL